MHQKKSEIQIGKDSTGVSSDFNPTPTIHNQSPQNLSNFNSNPHSTCSSSPSLCSPSIQSPDRNDNYGNALTTTTITSRSAIQEHQIVIDDVEYDFHSVVTPTPRSTPHKRSVFSQTTTNSLADSFSNSIRNTSKTIYPKRFCNAKSTVVHFLNRLRLRHLRRLRTHIRLILLLALPFFYFLVSNPSRSFILDFLSAFAFSAALLFSLNLALPRLPSIRLFLARSFPLKLPLSDKVSRSTLPVFWSIGSRTKTDHGYNSGCWVQAYNNGDIYEGEFHKGKCSGCGVYYYYMSGRYEGDWIDGKYDGYGVETWAKGSRYRGQYRQGLRHGFGVYRFYTGDVYAGEWSSGQSHGCGVHTCEDGSRYVGEFKCGVKHGLGHYHFRNGDTYAGEYFADKMHGFGVYNFANGHRYEGSWHEGRRQGLGMYTFKNGETHSGHWNNGILDIPSSHNANATHPVSPVAVYHSRVLNAVQEARRAAERAYDVGKVDERANRAVAAANRSANAARVAAVKAVQNQLPNRSNCHKLHNIYHSQTDYFHEPNL